MDDPLDLKSSGISEETMKEIYACKELKGYGIKLKVEESRKLRTPATKEDLIYYVKSLLNVVHDRAVVQGDLKAAELMLKVVTDLGRLSGLDIGGDGGGRIQIQNNINTPLVNPINIRRVSDCYNSEEV